MRLVFESQVPYMCCGTEAGSYLRLTDSFITQLKAQGPSRTCDESKEEDIIHAGPESGPGLSHFQGGSL